MKFRTKPKYTPEEDEYIANNYKLLPYQVIADHLGRSKGAIQDRVSRLGYRKNLQYNFVTRNIKLEEPLRLGYKQEAYNTEVEALSCPYYNPLELTGEEKQILNKL